MASGNEQSREEKAAAYMERFHHFRNHPRLVRGSVLSEAETNPKRRMVTVRSNATTFTYSAGQGDGASFYLQYGRTPDEIAELLEERGWSIIIQGRVEYLSAHENGFERIFVLEKPSVMKPHSKPEPYTLSDDEVARLADLFATLMRSNAYEPPDAVNYVIYNREAGP